MFYGLAHDEDYFSKALHKVVQLAPCFVAGPAPDYDTVDATLF